MIDGISAKDWDMTAWKRIPKVERLGIVMEIQRRFKFLCIETPNAELAVQHDASVTRHKSDREDKVKTQMQGALYWQKYKKAAVVTTAAALGRLVTEAGSGVTKQRDVYRDQIRVRKYCYCMKDLPAIGLIGDELEAADATAARSDVAA